MQKMDQLSTIVLKVMQYVGILNNRLCGPVEDFKLNVLVFFFFLMMRNEILPPLRHFSFELFEKLQVFGELDKNVTLHLLKKI